MSYDVDYSCVIPIDRDKFTALLTELKQEFAQEAA
jgi:hypothetical protein